MSDGSWKELDTKRHQVIVNGATEAPGSGALLDHKENGTYTCARCNSPLFRSSTKFNSQCGWPSFDQALPGAVLEIPDTDGMRVEIRCQHCDGHLGHVFRGERMTEKDTRHCVNSLSIEFETGNRELAFFAGGCFWGVEHILQQIDGVSSVVSGYMGGETQSPTYEAVCSGTTGHTETVRVTYDPGVVDYETLAKAFFEIHDPTQLNFQGPDVGTQYRSAIFFETQEQEATVHKLVAILETKGLKVVTQVEQGGIFWPAETYHQDYFERNAPGYVCHTQVKRF